jgi:hypothetical protein
MRLLSEPEFQAQDRRQKLQSKIPTSAETSIGAALVFKTTTG